MINTQKCSLRFKPEKQKSPVGNCLLEAAGLQDDRILQYSFLRVPRRDKKEDDTIYTFMLI